MSTLSTLSCQWCGIELKGKQTKFCSNRCKHKHRVHQDPDAVKRYARQKKDEQKAITDKIKLEKGCARCGYNEHPAALDFNHLDPSTKSFRIASDYTTKEKLMEEISKCEVLCANCHRIHTHENQHYTARMGRNGAPSSSTTTTTGTTWVEV